jgi:hypothetical protein
MPTSLISSSSGWRPPPKARIPAERIVNFMDVASLRARVKKLRDR